MDVTSFGIDHDILLRGIYVSRIDTVENGTLTTFDIRMKEPNRESVMDTSVMHTLEHLISVLWDVEPGCTQYLKVNLHLRIFCLSCKKLTNISLNITEKSLQQNHICAETILIII